MFTFAATLAALLIHSMNWLPTEKKKKKKKKLPTVSDCIANDALENLLKHGTGTADRISFPTHCGKTCMSCCEYLPTVMATIVN